VFSIYIELRSPVILSLCVMFHDDRVARHTCPFSSPSATGRAKVRGSDPLSPSGIQPSTSRYSPITKDITKLLDLSPRTNYTDRATAACRRS
jgi:hypothetical protein